MPEERWQGILFQAVHVILRRSAHLLLCVSPKFSCAPLFGSVMVPGLSRISETLCEALGGPQPFGALSLPGVPECTWRSARFVKSLEGFEASKASALRSFVNALGGLCAMLLSLLEALVTWPNQA